MFNLSLFSSKKSNWATPQGFFDLLDREFSFDLDACASIDDHKCEKYFSIEENGLIQDWFGTVWCNPPYGKTISQWVKKAFDYSGCSVLLLPSRTDTKWFHDYIIDNPRCELRFIRGRLHFGGSKNPAPFPSLIVVFRSL